MENQITRRGLLSHSVAASGVGVLGVALAYETAVGADGKPTVAPLKVVVAGGHPDDPESGAGGTMARLADLGHEVVALYLTRGEAGIAGKSHDEAAQIRSSEAQEACKILKARALFAGQIDGGSEINAARYEAFAKM